MTRLLRWCFGLLLLALLSGMLGLAALWWWVRSDDFHVRMQALATQELGLTVRWSTIGVDPWPVPAVALQRLEIHSTPPLSAERVEVRAALGPLLRGRVELGSIFVRKAQLPQAGVDGLLEARRKVVAGRPAAAPAAGQEAGGAAGPLVRRIVLDQVGWISGAGLSTTLDADARLGDDGLPDALDLQVRAGFFQGAHLKLDRSAPLRWKANAQLAGGTVQGAFGFAAPPLTAPELALDGQFETRGVALEALGRSVGRPLPLQGRLQADTRIEARAKGFANLGAALQTTSRVTVHDAVLQGLDLQRAVRTVGLSRGGETRLDTLSGQVATRGAAIQLNDLVASSGLLRATGNVAVSPARALSGRIEVDVAASALGRAVSVPLVVGGTTASPSVTLSRSAMLGAAIGTAVMPGAGTAAGARLGDQLGDKLKGIFGGK